MKVFSQMIELISMMGRVDRELIQSRLDGDRVTKGERMVRGSGG